MKSREHVCVCGPGKHHWFRYPHTHARLNENNRFLGFDFDFNSIFILASENPTSRNPYYRLFISVKYALDIIQCAKEQMQLYLIWSSITLDYNINVIRKTDVPMTVSLMVTSNGKLYSFFNRFNLEYLQYTAPQDRLGTFKVYFSIYL